MARHTRSLTSTVHLLSHISTLLLIVSSLTSPAHAQSFQPAVQTGSSSAFVEGQVLYILGGTPPSGILYGTPTTTQAFSIDLSVPWNASSPVYKKLSDGPSTWSRPSTLSSDNKNWFNLVNGTGYVYNVDSAAWSTVIPSNNNINTAYGLSAVTDPSTGLIYIPGGYLASKGDPTMLKIDLTKKSTESVAMSDLFGDYTAAWSASANSLILYTESADPLNTYNPSKGWSHISPKGDVPAPRTDACFIPAYGGKKMVLFGGYSRAQQASLNDVYVLDVGSMRWTRGPDAPATAKRDASACGFSSDYLVAWGGAVTGSDQGTLSGGTVLVYDVKNMAWSDGYDSTGSPSNPDDPRRKAAVIGGSVLGVLTLIVLVLGGVYLYKTKWQREPRTGGEKNPGKKGFFSSILSKHSGQKPRREMSSKDTYYV
ncbi:hypothetical protein BC939DRAFT_444639 [Gamsiella multidivaricata]|uniref:uncharacterized protein n=1 Tax=Gamsiella multidivaricata TaxID=101098 RepID=UPI00221F0972|nr:uncharacterized protein BC939DRAFT_444639 [Gamsiella multidivaricata]KAI7827562.1 hypothetical protein BC939DRAFT_444639 [Gamsiella multidivaricata]